jgi:hypothetical protein
MDTQFRRRNRRMDLRTTAEERELVNRAVTASGPLSPRSLGSQTVERRQRPTRPRPTRAAPTDATSQAIHRVRRYRPPELLADHHGLTEFGCRSTEQTDWLRRYARQSGATGTTRVVVVTGHQHHRVVAYYAWCMAQLHTEAVPGRVRAGRRYPQPAALLARLGVEGDHEGAGLGAGMLQDVFGLIELSDDIGCRGLLVHAESTEARNFYSHLVPEFEPSATDPLHLVLRMKDLRRTLQA